MSRIYNTTEMADAKIKAQFTAHLYQPWPHMRLVLSQCMLSNLLLFQVLHEMRSRSIPLIIFLHNMARHQKSS